MVCELGDGEEKLNTKGGLSFPECCVCDILLFVRFEDSTNANLPVLTPQNMSNKNWR